MRYKRDIFYLLLLLAFGLIFWSQALPPDKVFFLRDLCTETIPRRFFWVHSQGHFLWSPYIFFGNPYSANPQTEAFYPFNFLFLIFGAERGVVVYIIFHHLFFLLTLYIAMRRIEFSSGAALIGAVGLGFGGYLASASLLIVILSTLTWFPFLIILLDAVAQRGWFKCGLLLGPVLALQILGGEVELAGMTWALALLLLIFAPKERVWPRDLLRIAGSMTLGLVGAIVLSLPQLFLSLELIPISNRGEGFGLQDALIWSLKPSALKSLLVPNYILPLSSGVYWGLGFFSGYSFFLSFYLGITLMALAFFSLAHRARGKVYFWLSLALLGLVLMMGDFLPVYSFLHQFLPGFKLFRFPVKFFFILNFSVLVLALYGYEHLPRADRSLISGSVICFGLALVVIVFLLAFPVKVSELGNRYVDIAGYFLWRTVFRISALFFIVAGLALLGRNRKEFAGFMIALTIFVDLFFAHHLLNPAITRDFYQPNLFIGRFKESTKNLMIPPRIFSISPPKQDLIMQRQMDPVAFYGGIRDSLESVWAVYFGINNLRGAGSFYPRDVLKLKGILAKVKWDSSKIFLSRGGVQYIYSRDSGFEKLAGVFPRAMVFYQAIRFDDQDEIIDIWSDPNFCARRTVLLEADDRAIEPGQGLEMSEPAKIVRYENEKVEVEAEARKPGWLLLLDSYYPGWRAFVDGKPVKIYRADGFFRALPIPAGKHLVTFDYHPAAFYRSVKISAAGFALWLGLVIISFRRRKFCK